jgi:hypothetical protein
MTGLGGNTVYRWHTQHRYSLPIEVRPTAEGPVLATWTKTGSQCEWLNNTHGDPASIYVHWFGLEKPLHPGAAQG